MICLNTKIHCRQIPNAEYYTNKTMKHKRKSAGICTLPIPLTKALALPIARG